MEIMREEECVLNVRTILMVLTARDVNQAIIVLLEYPRHLVMPVKVIKLKYSVHFFLFQ